jgi:hypothetical protein
MLNAIQLQAAVAAGGTIATAAPGDSAPGDLAQLAGTWQNTDNLMGHRFRQDQHLARLQYVQSIEQIAAVDAASTPDTADTPKAAAIRHEPSLFLHQFDAGDLLDRGANRP